VSGQKQTKNQSQAHATGITICKILLVTKLSYKTISYDLSAELT